MDWYYYVDTATNRCYWSLTPPCYRDPGHHRAIASKTSDRMPEGSPLHDFTRVCEQTGMIEQLRKG